MSDSFTEVSHQSWGSRLVESIKGVLTGIVLFFGSIALLAWNERNAVVTAKSLTEGQGLVVAVKPDAVDASHEGKLVHVSGQATTTETLTDPQLGATGVAIKLARKVEMYQWKEEKKTEKKKELGGGEKTETTYIYTTQWDGDRNDSAQFKDSVKHQNPPMPLKSDRFQAKDVTLGAFKLNTDLVGAIDAKEALPATAEMLGKIADPALKARAKLAGPSIYIPLTAGATSTVDQPVVGDLRITFEVVRPTVVSLFSAQVGGTFAPYQTSAGKALQRLEVGTHTADEMFAAAQKENATLAWILRGVGWLMMTIGVSLVFSPLVTFADVVPFLGNFLGFGVLLGSAFVAFGVSLTTIAVSWIVVRPVLGASLLGLVLVAGGIFYAAGRKAKNVRKAVVS